MEVVIYTDGSSLGNPGPGGYGVVMLYGKHRKELARGYRKTTNNRMELMAVIAGLEALNQVDQTVHIYSDSRYIVDAVKQNWVFNWERKGFKKKKNPDLWKRFLQVYRRHQVTMHWVKGHAEIPENERCDALAVQAAKGKDAEGYFQPLLEDTGYEQPGVG